MLIWKKLFPYDIYLTILYKHAKQALWKWVSFQNDHLILTITYLCIQQVQRARAWIWSAGLYNNMFNNSSCPKAIVFKQHSAFGGYFVCYWICNGQKWHAYIIYDSKGYSKAVCFIVYGYAVSRKCLFSLERRPMHMFFVFFLGDTLFHPQLSLNPVHSTPLKGSHRKQFKLFIYETMQTLLKRRQGSRDFPLSFLVLSDLYKSLYFYAWVRVWCFLSVNMACEYGYF